MPLCAPKTRAATREREPQHTVLVPGPRGGRARAARAGRTRRGPSRAAGTGGSSLAQAAASTRGARRHMPAPHAQTAAPRPKRVAPGKRLRASVLPAPAAGGRCGACAHRSSRGQKPRAVAGGGRAGGRSAHRRLQKEAKRSPALPRGLMKRGGRGRGQLRCRGGPSGSGCSGQAEPRRPRPA